VTREPSRLLRDFEVDAVAAAAALALGALVWPGGGVGLAGAVLAGGALVWGSFRTLKASVDAALEGGRRPATLVKVFTRYGILAVAAYVMLARLRLHPVGVVIGASSLALATVAAAIRCQGSGGSVRPR
jgi:hypothetical protein